MALAYLAYVAGVLVLPGTVLWRRLAGRSGWLLVDAFLGTAFGVALECLVYVPGRRFGVPLLPLAIPAVALLVAVPARRRGRDDRTVRWWAAGGIWIAVAVVLTWFAGTGSRVVAVDGPGQLRPTTDAPFQLALAGELTHHFPPHVPYVAGEPLAYHWMVYAHVASAHWITGIELNVLIFRIVPLELILLTVLGLAAAAVVLSGRIAAAPVAALLAVAGGDLAAWRWTQHGGLYTDGPLAVPEVLSPTQALGCALLPALVAVTAVILHRSRPGPGPWVAALVLIAVLAAAKATILPAYGVGLAAAVAYRLVTRRTVDHAALGLGIATAAAFAVNAIVVVRGETYGMTIAPGRTYRELVAMMVRDRFHAGPVTVWLVAAVLVAGWLMPAAGMLLIRRHVRDDPTPVLLLGALLAGVAGASAGWQFMLSQIFFVRAVFGIGVLLAAWGLVCLPVRALLYVVPALAAGVAAAVLGRAAGPAAPSACPDLACVRAVLLVPPLVMGCLAALGVIVVAVAARVPRRGRTAVAAAVAIGLTVSPTASALAHPRAADATAHGRVTVTPGGVDAARYVRDHSGPDDLVATNVHCLVPARPPCPTASFWIAAYAERRVLVQGWAYTARADAAGEHQLAGPFWDPALLAANDAVFAAPDEVAVTRLRDVYGVRWLLLDDRVPGAGPQRLARFAHLELHTGNTWVYRVPPAP
ncbi:MAG TPA: hypothetical protein VGJ44_10900 [Kribbellaceae bacterium]